MKSITIQISTQSFNEISAALAAQGIKGLPDKLVIENINIAQPIDFRLATIRQMCLTEAVKIEPGARVIAVARDMFNFVIDSKEVIDNKQTEKEWK